MNFNENVKNNLNPILLNYGFEIIKEEKNLLIYCSSDYTIRFIHNERENSNSLSIGQKNQQEYPINDKILQSVFACNLKIEQLPLKIFIENLIKFLILLQK